MNLDRRKPSVRGMCQYETLPFWVSAMRLPRGKQQRLGVRHTLNNLIFSSSLFYLLPEVAVTSPHGTNTLIPKGSKVAVFPLTVPYESLKVGLVKEPTSSPELAERLARLRPSSSHYRPSEVSLGQNLPSIKDSEWSFQTLSPGPTSPDRYINTPALTIAVETLAPEEEEEETQSGDSLSSSGPRQEPPTPSPTVSNFFPDIDIDYSSPISRTASQRTRTSSFISRLTGGSKPSVSQRVFSKFAGSRKPPKASEPVTPSHKSGVESSRNSSEEYPPSEHPIPISLLGGQDHHSYLASELPFSPSDGAFSPSGLYTPSEYQFTRSRLYTPSERSSVAGTPRRSSLKNPLSKLSRSLRYNSSRVSFKNLSPISSGDRPLHSPETTTGEPHHDDLNPIQLGSPNFIPPSEDSTNPSPPSDSKPSVSPPVHVVPVSLPGDSIDNVVNNLKQTTTAPNTGPFQVVNPAEFVASPTIYPTEYGSPAATTVLPSSRPQSWWYSKILQTPKSSSTQPATFPQEEPPSPTEVTPKAATPAPLPPQARTQVESKASEAYPQDQSTKSSPVKGLFGAPTPFTRTGVLPTPPLSPVSHSPPSATSSVRSPHRTRKPTKSSLRKRSTSASPRPIRHTESILFPRPKEDDPRVSLSQVSSPSNSNYSFIDPANRPLPPSVFSGTAPPTVASPAIPLPNPEQIPLPASSFYTTPVDPACIPLPLSASTTAPPSAYPTPPSSVPTATRGLSPKHSRLGSRSSSRIGSRFTSRRSSRRNTVTRLPSIASSGKINSAVIESEEPAQAPNAATTLPTPPTSPPLADNLTSSPTKSLLSTPGSVTSRRSSVFKAFSRPNSRAPSIKALKSSLTALLSPKRSGSKNASQTTLPLEASTPTQGSVHELVQEATTFTEESEFSQELASNVTERPVSNQTTPKPSRKSSFSTLLRFTPSRKSSKPQLTRTLSEPLLSQQSTPKPQPTPKPQVYREASPSPQPQVYRQASPSPQPQLSRQSSQHDPSRRSSYHQIFTPSLKPSAHLAPNELTALPDEIIQHLPPEVIANMPMNGNIDSGYTDEFDYHGFNWFQNPPPKAEPPPPETISPPYVPMPGVVEQNEAFIYALQAAPNVLYGQYKQYGQLGVLAWCAEFSELIESMKQLGYDGNMFINTRSQALATCQELLKLKLDIKMQIIIIFLSSQVARLRRFLDGETEYDDYPVPQFPLDARNA